MDDSTTFGSKTVNFPTKALVMILLNDRRSRCLLKEGDYIFKDSIVIDTPLGQLIKAHDANEELTHVELPMTDNNPTDNCILWYKPAWKAAEERIIKERQRSSAERKWREHRNKKLEELANAIKTKLKIGTGNEQLDEKTCYDIAEKWIMTSSVALANAVGVDITSINKAVTENTEIVGGYLKMKEMGK